MKNILKFLGIIALAAVIVFSFASCNGDDETKDSPYTGDSSHLGETVTLSGQVYVENNGTYEKYSGGDLTVSELALNEKGAIKGGQFSLTLGKPKQFVNISEFIEEYISEPWNNVAASPSTAKIYLIDNFNIDDSNKYHSLYKRNISIINNEKVEESVEYWYVDNDVTISGKGKTTAESNWLYITTDLNIALKAGWNTLYIKQSTLGNTGNIAVSLDNPDRLKWVLDERSGDDDPEEQTPAEIGDFEEFNFTLPESTSANIATTGEGNSYLYKFTGDGFTKIKDALPGSYLEVTYRTTVSWAVGEIGWIDKTNAGAVIHGNGTNKNQRVNINVEYLVIGDTDFTIHIFNGATLIAVTLHSAPNGYVPTPNPKATAGAIPIFIPFGESVYGNGHLSKADFKKITTATSGKLVFYFDIDEAYKDYGILKFGPVCSDPYKHYGISEAGNAVDGDDGWRTIDAPEKETITYTVADIKAAISTATSSNSGYNFNKLEINQGHGDWVGSLLYIELIP